MLKTSDHIAHSFILLVRIAIITAFFVPWLPTVHAATLFGSRYDKVSDSTAGATTIHLIGFNYTDFASSIGSLQFEFCSNDPIPENACTAPSGFDASGVSLSEQEGETGFSIHPNTTANSVILTRIPAVPTVGPSKYELTDVINPATGGTYYIRLRSFTANDGTGVPVEQGGIALSINTPLSVSAEVPPFLRFCAGVTIVAFDCSSATSFYIDLGELSTNQTRTATSQMVAVSNAEFGYSITLSGTTMTSGNNTIPALTTQTASSSGTSQFGINLRANSNPSVGANPTGPGSASVTPTYNTPNLFRFNQGDVVASGTVSQDYRKYTVSYIVNISNGQPAGIYATTVSFICLANF